MRLSFQFMRLQKEKLPSYHYVTGLANEIVKIPSKYCTKKIVSCLCTSSLGHDSWFNSVLSLVLICIVSVSGSVLCIAFHSSDVYILWHVLTLIFSSIFHWKIWSCLCFQSHTCVISNMLLDGYVHYINRLILCFIKLQNA